MNNVPVLHFYLTCLILIIIAVAILFIMISVKSDSKQTKKYNKEINDKFIDALLDLEMLKYDVTNLWEVVICLRKKLIIHKILDGNDLDVTDKIAARNFKPKL